MEILEILLKELGNYNPHTTLKVEDLRVLIIKSIAELNRIEDRMGRYKNKSIL